MSARELAQLSDVEGKLREAKYDVQRRQLAKTDVLLGESPYALVACFELDGWEQLEETIFDVQTEMTRIAAGDSAGRMWDIYVVAFVHAPAANAAQTALREAVEADTRYARKLVRAAVPREALDRALRPLLPLREPMGLELADPLDELRGELHALPVANEIADVALAAFASTDSVEIS
ncbi:MAG: hypothetical protein ACYCUM_08845 [Solirubrobacteraceae bacterium]